MLNQFEMWEVPSVKGSTGLLAELRLEISDGHDLFGLDCSVVAKRIDCDEILVKTADDRFALVHLTWKSNPEVAGYPASDWSDAASCLKLIEAIQ